MPTFPPTCAEIATTSDATKDRFISSYHLPDQTLIRSPTLFNSVVLELVKLIQAALSVFGMFDLEREERNGLLCDVTCEGIQRWVTEIGEPLMNVEVRPPKFLRDNLSYRRSQWNELQILP